jgi:hypothetical protein
LSFWLDFLVWLCPALLCDFRWLDVCVLGCFFVLADDSVCAVLSTGGVATFPMLKLTVHLHAALSLVVWVELEWFFAEKNAEIAGWSNSKQV